MATAITVQSFQDTCAAIADAIVASDFAAANLLLGKAEAINAGLSARAIELTNDGSSIRRMESLEKLRATLKEVRQNAQQDPAADMAVSYASFEGSRD